MSLWKIADYQPPVDGFVTRLLHFEQLASTNDRVRELAEQGADEGLVAVAEVQTAGRGRLGRHWVAPAGSSLLFSLLFRPSEPFAYQASRITMLCGLALRDAVHQVSGIPVMLKWPNDLIVARGTQWKKLAGMLSEIGVCEGVPAFLVVGIGLNVNIAPEALHDLAPQATSLLAEGGQRVERVALLDVFLRALHSGTTRLRAGWDPLTAWRDRLAWMGQTVTVQTPTECVRGVAHDVDVEGALVLRLLEGGQRRFPVGDVSLRI